MSRAAFLFAIAAAWWLSATPSAPASAPGASVDSEVERAEERRVAAAALAAQSTIALLEQRDDNGGSGVIVSPQGLAVTNFHVVAPSGPRMTAATADGRLHDAVLVGLDPTGDIALVKLLGDGPFPAATWGDSSRVRIGDRAMVLGNPFLLADDYRPTLTVGVISGVGRYQFPSGSLLEYADCLQTDAAINPGNSGGPLFDGRARLIGVNGRGSFEKRGRVNVGIGYAVSSNQVRRFVPLLATGRVVDHASLGATVRSLAGGRVLVDAIDTGCDAYRVGLRTGDELESIGNREVRTANEVLNAVGVLPEGWRTTVAWRRGEQRFERPVRMGPLHAPGELAAAIQQMATPPSDKPGAQPAPPPTAKKPDPARDAWRAHYEEHPDFANRFFQRERLAAVLAAWRGAPAAEGPIRLAWIELGGDRRPAAAAIDDAGVEWRSRHGRFRYDAARSSIDDRVLPDAPGLLAGLWVWRMLLGHDAASSAGALSSVTAWGPLPWIADGPAAETVVVEHASIRVELAFDAATGKLLGFEASIDDTLDPTRVELEESSPGVVASMRVTVGERTWGRFEPADRAAPDRDPPSAE